MKNHRCGLIYGHRIKERVFDEFPRMSVKRRDEEVNQLEDTEGREYHFGAR
jgi:hypothetical protein